MIHCPACGAEARLDFYAGKALSLRCLARGCARRSPASGFRLRQARRRCLSQKRKPEFYLETEPGPR